jgi:4'-phosphopantetheinyl transferase
MCPHRLLPDDAAEPEPTLSVWLAGPAARPLFDPEVQSPPDQLRWQRLSNARRREDWEVSRALLAHVGSSRRSPVQAAGSPPFSLSHSGGHAAVALSRTARRVGVDLEQMRERDFVRLARFAFAPREQEQLEELQPAARAERFYFLWTLKEAFAKALSLPLLQSVAQCTFFQTSDAWHASVPTRAAWLAHVFRPRPSFMLSVVALLPEALESETLPPEEEKLAVKTYEWPEQRAPLWATLATLRSSEQRVENITP